MENNQPQPLNWLLNGGDKIVGPYFFTDWFRATSECTRYQICASHVQGEFTIYTYKEGDLAASRSCTVKSIIEALVFADQHNANVASINATIDMGNCDPAGPRLPRCGQTILVYAHPAYCNPGFYQAMVSALSDTMFNGASETGKFSKTLKYADYGTTWVFQGDAIPQLPMTTTKGQAQ